MKPDNGLEFASGQLVVSADVLRDGDVGSQVQAYAAALNNLASTWDVESSGAAAVDGTHQSGRNTKLQVHGNTNSGSSAPTVGCFVSADTYPVVTLFGFAHNTNGLIFDAYYDGSYRASHTSPSAMIRKNLGMLDFLYASGNSAGDSFSWANAMKIGLTDGHVGVNSDPDTYAYLKVAADTENNPVVLIENTDTGGASHILRLGLPNVTSYTDIDEFVQFYSNAGQEGAITGQADGTGVLYGQSSHIELKEDVQAAAGLLNRVRQIPVRDFRWRRSGKREIGLIAQEVHPHWRWATTDPANKALLNARTLVTYDLQVGDEVVNYRLLTDDPTLVVSELPAGVQNVATRALDPSDPEYRYLSIDFGRLTPLLLGAVQELAEQVDALQQEVARLRGES